VTAVCLDLGDDGLQLLPDQGVPAAEAPRRRRRYEFHEASGDSTIPANVVLRALHSVARHGRLLAHPRLLHDMPQAISGRGDHHDAQQDRSARNRVRTSRSPPPGISLVPEDLAKMIGRVDLRSSVPVDRLEALTDEGARP
jgi:hypothetical protein